MKGIIVIGTLVLGALGIMLLRRKLRPSSQPKVFVAGQNGVPHLVMDADGFVEPPASRSSESLPVAGPSSSSSPFGGSKHRSFGGVNMGHVSDSLPKARVSVKPAVVERGKILPFPTTQAEKQALIATRPRKLRLVTASPVGVGAGEKVVYMDNYRRAGKRR